MVARAGHGSSNRVFSELKPGNCFLRLVSSPDPVCNIATDFSGGKTGVKLSHPAVVFRDLIKYVLGPFYYTTPMCDKPGTSSPDEGENDDHDDDDDGGKERNY
ncbi:Pollen Ole e 1 allergen and extensin family protein [Striga hermonthica]|uniref:Pollen Ole e 1 allergen and extensin family protein n=1 Tax=Striga hermonthica TaxID=68872 RepID=A0A9N7N669_STRHE|nr:Pollen Ole e 1 allergen and extensin family protein [Striga hermonthica]